MSKEKVYIVVTHKHSLKPRTRTKEWEVTETVEFVNQLRKRHTTTSSAIGDYLNRTMITGSRIGMGDYEKFENYIRQKYEKQMAELDTAYDSVRKKPEPTDTAVFVDEFGNVRPKTVFDTV